jgi:hypothetical protein
VYNPLELIVPDVADQVTAVFVVPDTAAVNCCVAPALRLLLVGEIEIAVATAGGGGFEVDEATVTTAEADADADVLREPPDLAVTV